MAQVTAPAGLAPEVDLDTQAMDRGVGFLGSLWTSQGSMIGSGWLFGALTATSIAGPSALIAWGMATVIIIILALVHAELGGLFPVSGGTSRFPHYAFGSLAGGTFGWFSYIQAATIAPIEVLAVIQYASSYSWAHGWYKSSGALSGTGILVAIGLLVVAVIINLAGVRWFVRVNNALTSWKVLVPVLAIVVLVATHFHGSNFSQGGGFFVHHGGALKNILVAIPAGGIVFSLMGFEQALQLGGEARDPKQIPRAVIGSVLIGATIYILVQVAFIGALDPKLLTRGGTWTGLATPGHNAALGALNAAPFYSIAQVAGLAWLAVILRLDAIVSPGACGLVYLTATSRLSVGLSKNGYIPATFERNSPRTRVPVVGVVMSAAIGLLFLLPFPSWNKLVGVVTDASVMMYAGAPLALGALRRQKPNLPRPYKLPAGHILAPTAFVLASLIVYWTGWAIYSTLMIVMLIGWALMLISATFKLNPHRPAIDWRSGMFVFPYMIGMGVISYLGQFPSTPKGVLDGIGPFNTVLVGGTGVIPFYWDLLVVTAFSLAIYHLAIAKRLPTGAVDENVRELYPLPVADIK